MAESTLSSGYVQFMNAVSYFLHGKADYTDLEASDQSICDTIVQSGYRRFLYPPAFEGIQVGYGWSFLKPTTTIDTADGDAAIDLPDDFGHISGDFYFDESEQACSVTVVSEHRIETLLQHSEEEGRPRHAAIRFKDSDGSDGQRQEIVWWPIPDDAYTLTYRYEAYTGILTTGNPYPLGGMKFSEVITESCLALAQQRRNDENGFHLEEFVRLLKTAIEQDRKNGARYYGHMGGSEAGRLHNRTRYLQNSYDITYKGVTY